MKYSSSYAVGEGKIRCGTYHDLIGAGMHAIFQQEVPNGMYCSEDLVKERNIVLKWIFKKYRQSGWRTRYGG
jgi:hypothetical protein